MSGPRLTGLAVSVIGAARSGVAAAALLHRNGARVFVSDALPRERLAEQTARLEELGIEYETGGHTDRALDAELIVLSPGVPDDAPVVRSAAARGMRIVSELEMASWFCRSPIAAVTGTNGKTTTTTLIGRMFQDAKKPCAVAGNIGSAFSGCVNDLDASSVAVLEVSSFQLDHIESFRPAVAVLLNITPDHLDRYGRSFEKYAASKCRIFENQTMNDVLIYNTDDSETTRRVQTLARPHVRVLPFGLQRQARDGAWVEQGVLVVNLAGKSEEIVPAREISIPGQHNLSNSMAAALVARSLGVSAASIRATLRNFKGVEHRLEFVRELGGVRYVNDSKATNVDSVWYALGSYSEPIVLLLGGRDKGNDYDRINELVRRRVKAIVAIGESADKVERAFSHVTATVVARSMEEAVRRAHQLAAPGDVVLLSPACASFDWFRDYEHRGKVFKELVRALR